jgi:hypothetical protein
METAEENTIANLIRKAGTTAEDFFARTDVYRGGMKINDALAIVWGGKCHVTREDMKKPIKEMGHYKDMPDVPYVAI